jgi:hypothetical protein
VLEFYTSAPIGTVFYFKDIGCRPVSDFKRMLLLI